MRRSRIDPDADGLMDARTTTLRRDEVLSLLSTAVTAVPGLSHSKASWTERLRIAGARLHPWVAYRVDRLGLMDALPVDAQRTLRAATTASVIDELRRRSAFVQYADALDAAAIPFVVLKGMALAYTVYPAPAVRPMGDVDLWVECDRLSEVVTILGALGWKRPARREAYPPASPGASLELELPGTRSQIELHTRPVSLARIEGPGIDGSGIAGVWDRAVPARIAGRSIRICGVADQLAHLCIHVSVKNGFADGLLGLLDVALTAHLVPDDDTWSAMGAAHRAQGIAPWTTLTLMLARDLVGAPVPAAYFLTAAVQPPDVKAAALEQLWDRDTSDIRGIDGLVGAGAGGAFGAIKAYVRLFHAGPRAAGETRLHALGTRLRYDLTGRLARYAKAFVRGEFRPDRLRHRGRVLRERTALIELLERATRPLTPGSGAPSAPR